jgi:hypothetical protein
MVEKVKREKKRINFYKFTTFVLVGLILVVVLGFVGVSMLSSAYDEGIVDGQQNAVSILLNEVNEKGFVDINLGENKSVVLVPRGLGEQNMVNGIISSINDNGYVEINLGINNSFILVPYTGE